MSKEKRLKNQKVAKLDGNNVEGKKDKSQHVPQEKKLDWDLNIRVRHELTEKQKIIVETMTHKDTRCVMIDGLYGTSKTWCAVLASLKLLNDKRADGVIYIRNPVESTTTGKLGFIKGDSNEKMLPYGAAFVQKLDEFISHAEVDKLTKEQKIEVLPLGFTRGLSWNCKIIIVDEAACLTYDDFFLLMTRCGPFTKIFFVGDSQNQSDIGNKTGFARMFNIFNDKESMENGVFCFELKSPEDVVRSGFVRFVMTKTGLIKNYSKEVIKTLSASMFPEKQ